MSRLARLSFACAAVACGAFAQVRCNVELALPPAGPAFGEPFEIVIACEHDASAQWEPLDERTLAPLAVELVGTEREDAPPNVRELRRYRARAFVVGEVRLGRIDVRLQTVSGPVMVSSTLRPFVVRSILPEPPGDVEWAGDVREPRGRLPIVWLLALAAVLAAAVWRWRRPRPVRAAAILAPAAPPVHERALAELEALMLPGDDPAAVEAFYVQLAEVVRGHCGRRFALRAEVRTSEELAAAVSSGREPLARCLHGCDAVKFAAMRPAAARRAAGRAEALADARTFVLATAEAAT